MLSGRRVAALAATGLAALVAASLAGFGAAAAFVTPGDHLPSPVALVPDSRGPHIAVAAPDPSSTQSLPWAVRVYRSQTQLVCPEVGRVEGQIRNGKYGTVDDEDGSFRPGRLEGAAFGGTNPNTGKFDKYPTSDQGGSCTDLNGAPASIAVNHYPAEGVRGARAVVFGVVSSDVVDVHLQIGGETRDLPFKEADAYIGVLTEDEAARAELVFSLKDGSVKRASVAPPGSTVPAVPAPPESGGAASTTPTPGDS